MSPASRTARPGWKRPPTAAEVEAGPLPPVVLLHGPEEYLMEQTVQVLWKHATDPAMADFNRDLFHADEVRSETLFAQAASFPMMAERRLVVLKRAEKALVPLLNDLAAYAERPSPSTCLVVCAMALDKRRKAWQRLLAAATVLEFKPLGTTELAAWLEQACAERGRRLPRPLAQRLAEQLGPAPLRMALREVEKLCLLAAEGVEVSEEDLAATLGMEPDAKPWDLENAVLAGDAARALAVLQSLLRRPDNEFMLLGMLGKGMGRLWFMRRLAERGLPQDEIPARLGLSSFQAARALQALRAWPLERVENAVRLLREADLGLKGDSALPSSQIYFQLVVRLCRPS
jgi:DNA polymerase-3 subunit delta